MRPLLFAIGLAACTSHVSGDLTVDGTPFKVTTCRSGAAYNFSGLQITNDQGIQLRVMQKVDGTVAVAVFAPNAAKGDTVSDNCGTIKIETQNSKINNVRNVEGSINLACEGAGHKVAGSLTFENCH
ncbi:MAG TPA: hypothetical protein VGC41_25430 [Kofleriaceae bacterium]